MKKKKVITIIVSVIIISILLGVFYFLKIEWKSKFEISKITPDSRSGFLNLKGKIRNKTNSDYRFVWVTVQLTNGSSQIKKDVLVGEIKAKQTVELFGIMSEEDALEIENYIPEKVLKVKFSY